MSASTATPLPLTDSQLAHVMRMATPLHPRDRSAFLEMVADRLRAGAELGDGAVARACRRASLSTRSSRF